MKTRPVATAPSGGAGRVTAHCASEIFGHGATFGTAERGALDAHGAIAQRINDGGRGALSKRIRGRGPGFRLAIVASGAASLKQALAAGWRTLRRSSVET